MATVLLAALALSGCATKANLSSTSRIVLFSQFADGTATERRVLTRVSLVTAALVGLIPPSSYRHEEPRGAVAPRPLIW
jgi:hypothetical protein